MSKKLTKEEFINNSRKVHGDKYDYSKSEYISNRESVKIICPIHGEFEQVAGTHMKGSGCPRYAHSIITKDDFLEKAIEKHGDKFDYSISEYKGYKNKIKIICKKHGMFETSVYTHLRDGGCLECLKENRTRYITKEDFIVKANEIHNKKFSYEKVNDVFEYYNKITIICPKHGEFTTIPYEHLELKRGCPKCSHRGLTNDEWIELFKETHGDKYVYDKFEYKGSDKKSVIICPKHGEFEQTPQHHLSGQGCKKCKSEKLHSLNCKTTEKFIEEARVIHGDKYDYSKVDYKRNHIKVCIICPKHGEFWQDPTIHICQKSGCKKCATEADLNRRRDTFDDFVKKAQSIHGDKYDYSLVNYKSSMEKVCIICPNHGKFYQRPDSHINGKGCNKCKTRKKESYISKLLKDNNMDYEYQKGFDWLKYIGKQFIDFYIPKYNIAIEYQGEQHYRPVKFYNCTNEVAETNLIEQQKRDDNKKQLCESHGIKLYYILYNDDVEKRLNEILDDAKSCKID